LNALYLLYSPVGLSTDMQISTGAIYLP
jgi:hypothetical protein